MPRWTSSGILNREFPNDPEVLYLATHLFSDLSIRASQQLLYAAPSAYQVHELNAEALEAQGKWDEAAVGIWRGAQEEPEREGYSLSPGPPAAFRSKEGRTTQAARREFEEELKIDPANAGAEYVLGELARQDQQFPAAIEHFGRAAKLDASFADAFIGLGRSLLDGGRIAEAVRPSRPPASSSRIIPRRISPRHGLSPRGAQGQANHEFALHQQTSEKARQRKEAHSGRASPDLSR